MSYDFILLHREPGQSWDEALEANERLAMAAAVSGGYADTSAWLSARFSAHQAGPRPE